ncbi:MAG: sulfatase-like hydrolase/transferase [Thermoanaerobaculia bacterium]
MRRALLVTIALLAACGGEAPEVAERPRPSILLVTLDTTRADAIGPDAEGVETPAFDALAAHGVRFTQAYATVPQTLPSHVSMMTGLYPGGHGIHENARYLAPGQPLLAERLRDAGYRTAAFVSAYPLDSEFGLARGFAVYDDALPEGRSERSAAETTDRAIAFVQANEDEPLFLWVHYFEPHHPYEPPEPFRSRYAGDPYLGEIAAMDAQLGRLLEAFDAAVTEPSAIIVAGDHGESLGEHGEAQHGNLVYQGAMHVPLVLAGEGVETRVVRAPVSIRSVHHTILDLAGLETEGSLRGESQEAVLGEAMQPFLQYGWQPQVMAIDGTTKVIQAGGIEVYDLAKDPAETTNVAATAALSRELRQAIRDYPIPTPGAPADAALDDEDRRRLASLGYVTSNAKPVVRPDAPKPSDMAHLFDDLDRASALFVAGEYDRAIPVLETILAADPHNVAMALRLAAAHSALGHDERALEAFRRAEAIAPGSSDVKHFLALHYVRTGRWERAAPLLETVLAETPGRVPAIEALAAIREREGRVAMAAGNTPVALEAFEKARALRGKAFRHDLELGVLYLDARRLAEARDALDRVPPDSPAYSMALFKRAQVSVLLGEPDRAARIAKAREHADATTRELIARERLFR